MDFSGIKTVVVDDAKLNLMLIAAMAKEIGLKVTTFLDPLEALSYIQQNAVDLVLTDYMMPKMDGLQLTREIRKVYHRIPIVMITAATDTPELKAEAMKSGATHFLTKPLNGTEFVKQVTELVCAYQAGNSPEDPLTAPH